MSRLEVRLFGPLDVRLDDQPASGFDSDKVRALLAYLAAEAGRPHRRQSLAGLLWPEWSEREARTNLRSALANLRRVIGDADAQPPYLNISRASIQINLASEIWVDVLAFESQQADSESPQESMQALERALELYRGDFLEGFSIEDSVAFEDWITLQREKFRRGALDLHGRAADHFEQQLEYSEALRHARAQLELEPWLESAHRRAMRALALGGDRAAALAQYERCQEALRAELGVEPEPETVELHERIRKGELKAGTPRPTDDSIRGYQLREQIGRGGYGVIYRAHQAAVGREVAIKVIRPEYANQPEFIRRFEAEAQLVARLEHPHIVPLFDYWRDPHGAYLVTRWFRAGNLKDALQRGPWKPEAAVRLVNQIADALATAHRQGVVHRDLKPQNILLDDDGNAYLADFGIAADLAGLVETERSDSEGLLGTPGYTPPEQIRGLPATPNSDIYSLGVVLFELLAGEPPFGDLPPAEQLEQHLTQPLPDLNQLRPDLPSAVNQVIQQATAKDPSARASDALAVASAFSEALAGSAVRPISGSIRNPYKGLRAFQQADAEDFFGRESLVEQLLARLNPDGRFLAVVGPSGSGKSSAVKAGLLPALRAGGLPGSADWFYVEMYPGHRPLEELEAALLRIAVNPPASLIQQLQESDTGLRRAVKRVMPEGGGELVLVIDQFEELFSAAVSETSRAHFLDGLEAALTDPAGRLRVIVTLRADYYDRPLQYPEFGALMKSNAEIVLPMSAAELEQAIVGPAQASGINFEPALVGRLVGDVLRQPGGLPLLQYSLTELFERRQDARIPLAAYDESGGVTGALAARAEGLYQELDQPARDLTRQLFLRLVELTETTEERRRRVLRTELALLAEDSDAMATVIDEFGRYRLLTFDRHPQSRAPTVEIAHEALLHEWSRLRQWIADSRELVIVQGRLATAAAEWDEAERAPGYLAGGSRLRQFESLVDQAQVVLTPGEKQYFEASLQREAEQLRHERALQLRARNRLRALVAVFAVAAVVAGGLSVFAFSQSREATRQSELAQERGEQAQVQAAIAEEQRSRAEMQSQKALSQARLATARQLAAASVANLNKDPQLSILLALQAAETTRSAGEGLTREAEEALHQAVLNARLERIISPEGTDGGIVPSVAAVFSPDGSRLAVGAGDGVVRLYDPDTGQELDRLLGHNDSVIDVKWSPDGLRLLSVSLDGTARMWDIANGSELQRYGPVEGGLLIGSISPDGARVVASGGETGAVVWDAATADELLTIPAPFPLSAVGVAFDPITGDRLAIAFEGPGELGAGVDIVDSRTGKQLVHMSAIDGICELRWSPDGTRIATASADTTGAVWNSATGEPLTVFDEHHSFLCTVDFSPDGLLVATGGNDGAARVWEADGGRQLVALEGHEERVGFVAFRPDGTQLVTSSEDDLIRLWNIGPAGRREVLSVPDSEVNLRAHYTADGSAFLSASFDGTARLWDVASGERLAELRGHESWVYDVDISQDGSLALTGSRDMTARVWDLATESELQRLDVPIPAIGVAFDPEAKRALVGTFVTMTLWELESDRQRTLVDFDAEQGQFFGMAFSPDGSLIAAGEAFSIRFWETDTGDALPPLIFEDQFFHDVLSIEFSADGDRLLTAHWDGTVRIWDVAERSLLQIFDGHRGSVWDASFSPDETLIASASFDGSVRLWDAETGEELLRFEDAQAFTSASFSPDGKHLLVTGDFGARIYVVEPDDLIELAHTRLLRWWTPAECFQYLGSEQCPQPPPDLELQFDG